MPKRSEERDSEDHDETQQTPAGLEISVPTRGDVLRDLRKAARPRPQSEDAGGTEDQQ